MALSEIERRTLAAMLFLEHLRKLGAKVAPFREFLSRSDTWTRSEQNEQTLDEALDHLQAAGLVVPVDDIYRLTDEGRDEAKQYTSEEFGKVAAIERSAAFQAFCQKVYGASRCQLNMATEQQLSKLIEVLRLGEKDRVVDLGCNIGTISEHIADVTGAKLLGIDFAASAIEAAQERTRGKSEQLSFQVMDMDKMHLPENAFDAIIAIDTLYFVHDLGSVVAAAKNSLRDGGRMGLFYTTRVAPDESKQKLEPTNTPLAKALRSSHLDFQTWDYTEDEKGVWERQLQVAEELKPAFESEGALQICQERISEATFSLEFCNSGRSSRYLYYAYR